MIDWSLIKGLLSDIHNRPKSEKAWPPLLMFKALLLQGWYKLSDLGLEKQLTRDLLFRRFIGLDIAASVPDHSTIWRFRQLLEAGSLMEPLLEEVNRQLDEQSLYIQSGEVSIIDASVIEAKQCPNKKKDGTTTQDPEAGWNIKAGSDGKRKATYVFKAHLNVEEDGFFRTKPVFLPLALILEVCVCERRPMTSHHRVLCSITVKHLMNIGDRDSDLINSVCVFLKRYE